LLTADHPIRDKPCKADKEEPAACPPRLLRDVGEMDELWMRSVATIYEGKIEDFKKLAEEMLSTIRAKDSGTLNFAIFLDEPTRVVVFLEEYASSAGWLEHRTNFGPLLPRVPEVCKFTQVEVYGDPTPEARATLAEAGPTMSYYPALSAL
jgi:quinol monooxygenase YgiN